MLKISQNSLWLKCLGDKHLKIRYFQYKFKIIIEKDLEILELPQFTDLKFQVDSKFEFIENVAS